jgi:hypothetical protein
MYRSNRTAENCSKMQSPATRAVLDTSIFSKAFSPLNVHGEAGILLATSFGDQKVYLCHPRRSSSPYRSCLDAFWTHLESSL